MWQRVWLHSGWLVCWAQSENLLPLECVFTLQSPPPTCYSALLFPSLLLSCSVNGMEFLMWVLLWGVRVNFWSHLCKVQNQAKLIYAVGSQESGYPRKEALRGLWGSGNVLPLDLRVIFVKRHQTYTYDLGTFLCRCSTPITSS